MACPQSKPLKIRVKCRLDVQASAKAARGNFVWPYGIAILAIALALGLKLALASKLHGEASYLFFMPAILIASALGGWGLAYSRPALGFCLGSTSSSLQTRSCRRM